MNLFNSLAISQHQSLDATKTFSDSPWPAGAGSGEVPGAEARAPGPGGILAPMGVIWRNHESDRKSVV